ncbi:hypothetical protein EG329_004667 [Mollisiaceae sp. DMI_Dod_QoI]|nr:hypothetical protein EG329_004667 [Helotiales sp. DMI_Dod_QoI]
MPPRFKSLIVLTFIVLALYAIFWRDTPFSSGQHAIDVLKGTFGDIEVPFGQDVAPVETKLANFDDGYLKDIELEPTSTKEAYILPTYSSVLPSAPESTKSAELEHVAEDMKFGQPSTKSFAELPKPSAEPDNDYSGGGLQVQFDKEYDALGLDENAGAIYGNTLKTLVDNEAHEGFAAAALTPTESWPSYSDTPPYTYNPYPDYNSKVWQAANQGKYTPCIGPQGSIADLIVLSGHPKAFGNPQLGSYVPLDIDSNLCFERETRLSQYGFRAEDNPQETATFQSYGSQTTAVSKAHENRDVATVDWGKLQQICYKKNTNRYTAPQARQPLLPVGGGLNATSRLNKTRNTSTMGRRLDTIVKRYLNIRQESDEDVPETQLGKGDPKAEYLEEDISDFQADQYDDESPFSGLGEGLPMKEDTQHDVSEGSNLGDDEFSNEASPYEVIQFSGLAEDKSIKEDDDHQTSQFLDGEAEESIKEDLHHDDPQFSELSEGETTKGQENDIPVLPDLSEGTQVSQGLSEDEAKSQGLHGMPKLTITPTSRTAVVIRTYSRLNFTENDKQNIRAMVTELSLRSGGEYEIFLLVEYEDETLPVFSDHILYKKALENSVPKEFASMTVLWNPAKMREVYPFIPKEVNNVHQSQWLSVQWFAQEHPDFDFYWNWEFDTRYTGHYYNLLEKLAAFAKAQPRKGLWERNERYYIPSYHGRYSKFIKDVENIAGSDTVWGAPVTLNVSSVGPTPPISDPKDDEYVWGVGEDADYISLSPIFNPVNTNWPGKNDVWGYDGQENTARRASIGTQSRCSKKLLDTMHTENKKGNHVGSKMAPQTVSLLHGLKAVYAPVPIFFDRSWDGRSLQRYFNPGPKGESGSVEESPYSRGRETRFNGGTWYYGATPQRLYNNWLGWEDLGIGGPEWEKAHGRMCLPPLLLHPVKNVFAPPPNFS